MTTMSSHDEIARLSHVILDAIVARDARTLDAWLDDDFVSLSAAGGRQHRREFIRAIAEASYTVIAASFEALEIELFDQVAVVVGIQRAEALLPDGARVTSRGAFTDVFVHKETGWRLRVAESTELA